MPPVQSLACEVDAARRFGGIGRLYGPQANAFLADQLAVMVIGVGGVGSWAVEALARSGVGHLILVDLDQVAESNVNRQIQATDSNLGKAKVTALAEHVASYSPTAQVECVEAFFEAETAETLMARLLSIRQGGKSIAVLDCCDQVRAKVLIAQLCMRQKIPFVLAGSAGGKVEPWRIGPADLKDTTHDPLLAKVRYQLRKQGRFSEDKKMNVPVFFSPEQVKQSGGVSQAGAGLNCAGYGSAVSVTATMGMQMAGWLMNRLLAKLPA